MSGDSQDRTIFVRNISWSATEDDLRDVPAFQKCCHVKIPVDRESGRPRGFGFVEFSSVEDCQEALANADNIEIDGRVIICQQSQKQGGGGGGFRGGRGGGFGGGQRQGGYQQGGGYNNGGGYQQRGGYQQQQGGFQQQQGGFQQGGYQQGGY